MNRFFKHLCFVVVVFLIGTQLNAAVNDNVKIILLFDGSYSDFKRELDFVLENTNLKKVYSKSPDALEIRMINDVEMSGSINHSFDGDRISCKLDPKSTKCSPCNRLQQSAGNSSETNVIIDVQHAKWVGECTDYSIEQIDISENTDFYKDYYLEYVKRAKQSGQSYRIVIWWPTAAVSFKLAPSQSETIKYGDQVDFVLESTSQESYEVVWSITDANNKTTSLKSTTSSNSPARYTNKMVSPIRIEASVPACNVKRTLEAAPDEICEEINMSVLPQVDEDIYIKKWRLLKSKPSEEQAQYEVVRYSGGSTYVFKVPRQCGVESYSLFISRFGEESYTELDMSPSSQISDDPDALLLAVRFADIESAGFLESDEFEGLCQLYIAPKKFDRNLRLFGKKGEKVYRVIFQKCA